jgi:hypothetical protein
MKGYAGYGLMFSKYTPGVGRDLWKQPVRYAPQEPLIIDQFMTAHLGAAAAYTNCGNIVMTELTPSFPHETLCIGFNDGSAQALPVRQALTMNGKRLMKDLMYNP